MLSTNFIKKVLEKIKSNVVSKEEINKLLINIHKYKDLYESIFDSMIEGLIVIDENNSIKYINNNALKMLEKDFKVVINNDIFKVIKNKELLKFLKNELIKGEKKLNKEIEIENHNNFEENTILRINIFPLMKKLNIKGSIIMFLDITEQKKEQYKLRRAESLASLTTLAAGVAHEIKNPLSSIDIQVQLMDRYISKIKDNNIRENFNETLSIVSEEISRLNNIVSDFLFSVRPTILNKKLIDIEKLFNEMLNLLLPKLEETGISITLKVEKNFPKIIADPNYIKNAFLNLIKNSVEACKKGDKITISVYRKENNAIIKISDTGNGISKKELTKIFEPYYTTKDFGTGLGLTIVYKIIKEHKGEISVKSNLNRGTNFIVTLPIYDEGKKLLENKAN